jgi:hypothetical protein
MNTVLLPAGPRKSCRLQCQSVPAAAIKRHERKREHATGPSYCQWLSLLVQKVNHGLVVNLKARSPDLTGRAGRGEGEERVLRDGDRSKRCRGYHLKFGSVGSNGVEKI